MPRITNTAQMILEFVNRFVQENGYAPTVREIGAAVGLRSPSTVHYQLARLREQGQLTGDPSKSRAVTLAEEPPRGIPHETSKRQRSDGITSGDYSPLTYPKQERGFSENEI